MTPYEHLKQKALENIPGLKIKEKEDSWFWRMLPDVFLKDTAVALASTVWLPDVKDDNTLWDELAHELTHVMDWRAGRLKYVLQRTFPQNLSLICLAMTALWVFATDASWLWLLNSLVLLLPWRSPTRARLEIRAYYAGLFCHYLKNLRPEQFIELHDDVIDSLASWIYYGMISRKKAEELLPINELFDRFEAMHSKEPVTFFFHSIDDVYDKHSPPFPFTFWISQSFNNAKTTHSD